jgi:hypothetical protein
MSNSTTTTARREDGSRLFYYGTQIEVRLGDRVRWRRWFRSDLEGIVCYLPGISPRHPEMANDYGLEWAIRTNDGTIWTMGYCPDRAQPRKNLQFVARSIERGIGPETTLG